MVPGATARCYLGLARDAAPAIPMPDETDLRAAAAAARPDAFVSYTRDDSEIVERILEGVVINRRATSGRIRPPRLL